MRHNVLCTIGSFDREAREILEAVGSGVYEDIPSGALSAAVRSSTVLIVAPEVRVSADVISAAAHLQLIATPATGTDNIDLKAAGERGIPVLSLREDVEFLKSVTATAELALGLMIDLMRRTHEAAEAVRRREWNRTAWMGRSLSGKTLGIVGLGRIGLMMARCSAALGMRVLYTDPVARDASYQYADFEKLLTCSDVISLHVHLTPSTELLIDAKALARTKRGAVLVNTARGRIVDEPAVIEALESGHLAGYAADVLANELSFANGIAEDPLVSYAIRHRNVILTPHIGGMAVEARAATDRRIAAAIVQALSHDGLSSSK